MTYVLLGTSHNFLGSKNTTTRPKMMHLTRTYSSKLIDYGSCASTASCSPNNAFLSLPTSIYKLKDPVRDGNVAVNLCSYLSNCPTVASVVRDIEANVSCIEGFWLQCPNAREWLPHHTLERCLSSYAMIVVEDALGHNPQDPFSAGRQ